MLLAMLEETVGILLHRLAELRLEDLLLFALVAVEDLQAFLHGLVAEQHEQRRVAAVVEDHVGIFLAPVEDAVGVFPVFLERLALDGEDRRARDGQAAAAWSWVEKMLQLAQRTRAPEACSVSTSTAVWIVMWMRPRDAGALQRLGLGVFRSRTLISPGISCSASSISLRPNSANDRSFTTASKTFLRALAIFDSFG
jgi:hypothetical protein